jgi:hypothetical protein
MADSPPTRATGPRWSRGGAIRPFDSALSSRPICERFDQIAARYSAMTAVDDGDICFTSGEIQRASLVLARNIEARVPPGNPVGVLLEHSAFFPIAALACLRVG